VAGEHIGMASKLSIREANDWFNELPEKLSDKQNAIAKAILKEIRDRLKFPQRCRPAISDAVALLRHAVGRRKPAHSPRLADRVGADRCALCARRAFIGLHQRDNDRLLETLKHLRDLGNTVIVVEHDEDAVRTADYVVDIGPGAGVHGGEIVAEGTPQEVMANPKSLTGQYLSGAKAIPVPSKRRKGKKGQSIKVKGARGNNLKGVDATVPLGTFTCVTGVSGGGKSTFLLETLYKVAARRR
jgi:excinuclease ABC subunit A